MPATWSANQCERASMTPGRYGNGVGKLWSSYQSAPPGERAVVEANGDFDTPDIGGGGQPEWIGLGIDPANDRLVVSDARDDASGIRIASHDGTYSIASVQAEKLQITGWPGLPIVNCNYRLQRFSVPQLWRPRTVRPVRAASSACQYHWGWWLRCTDGYWRPVICSGWGHFDYGRGEAYMHNGFVYGLLRYRTPDTYVVRFDSSPPAVQQT